MDSVQSFKGYGKVDETDDRALRRKLSWQRFFIAVCSIILIAAVVTIAIGISLRKKHGGSGSTSALSGMTPSASIKAVCNVTLYPDSCFSSISKDKNSNTTDPVEIFKISLLVAMRELVGVDDHSNELLSQVNDTLELSTLGVCQEVLADAVNALNESISIADVKGGEIISAKKIGDLRTWLSTVVSNQETCLDSLEDANSTHLDDMKLAMTNSTEYSSNSLAIVTKIMGLLSKFHIPMHRRLLRFGVSDDPEFPTWLSPADRRLLQETNPTPHLVVAQDGTGNYTTITEALEAVPDKSSSRSVIYVKAGTYEDNVILTKNKWNVMIYGDGMTETIVTGSKNFVDGTSTLATATFTAKGKGFIARDMGFMNTAGPKKHQAVAFRSASDLSVMYRCYFDAYQDTLYAHTNRQFYRECDITGTVDFIFGYGVVVIQNCNIRPRQPIAGQINTITAQGRSDPNLKSGISIQGCTITANGNLTAQTYLGRPWKAYSTTVFMQSSLGSFINPKGWTEWVRNVIPPSTIFYGEYLNTGPGSDTSGRVTWPGYKPALTSALAGSFTVNSFIDGSTWLPQLSLPFDSSL
ncbi:pectinesterase 3-like [Punica granatum]|uniref:Pectinesterase n=1 Tax=Punica granatum TaxID=22663 RepID=A0A218W686_PUNGR|nr:pectinesterase 3-like [Punica granatum]OWM68387.1 hypothetical protein CDL15_Pgr004869 [Punica granatum]